MSIVASLSNRPSCKLTQAKINWLIIRLMQYRNNKAAAYVDVIDKTRANEDLPPSLPVTCCMSGCANCVWLKYCEELIEYYRGDKSRAKSALEKIEDPSIRALVKMELGI